MLMRLEVCVSFRLPTLLLPLIPLHLCLWRRCLLRCPPLRCLWGSWL